MCWFADWVTLLNARCKHMIHKVQLTVERRSKFRYSVCTSRVTVLVCVPENCTGVYSVQYSAVLPLVFCLRAQNNPLFFSESLFTFF